MPLFFNRNEFDGSRSSPQKQKRLLLCNDLSTKLYQADTKERYIPCLFHQVIPLLGRLGKLSQINLLAAQTFYNHRMLHRSAIVTKQQSSKRHKQPLCVCACACVCNSLCLRRGTSVKQLCLQTQTSEFCSVDQAGSIEGKMRGRITTQVMGSGGVAGGKGRKEKEEWMDG